MRAHSSLERSIFEVTKVRDEEKQWKRPFASKSTMTSCYFLWLRSFQCQYGWREVSVHSGTRWKTGITTWLHFSFQTATIELSEGFTSQSSLKTNMSGKELQGGFSQVKLCGEKTNKSSVSTNNNRSEISLQHPLNSMIYSAVLRARSMR